MAVNAGTPRVGVSYGAHHQDTFEAHQPLFVAHSTAELHAWLMDNA
jgi:phosphoglycolate phosphatase